MLAINQPRGSHLDRASRIWSTISLDKAAAWHSFISSSSLSGLNADFLNYRSALSNPTPQRRVLWVPAYAETSIVYVQASETYGSCIETLNLHVDLESRKVTP